MVSDGGAHPARRIKFVAALGMLCVVVTTPASATRAPRISAPNLIRLEGYVAKGPVEPKPEAHLVLQYQGKDYEFDLSKMVIVTGDHSYSQVLQEITPYRVSFFLRGSSPAVSKLTGATAGQKLILLGYHRTGSRDLQLIDVTEAPPDPTPTAP